MSMKSLRLQNNESRGEVFIRVAAASINPVDLLQLRAQQNDYMPVEFPGGIGWKLSGTVVRATSVAVRAIESISRIRNWIGQAAATP